jgi:hypothetical protein
MSPTDITISPPSHAPLTLVIVVGCMIQPIRKESVANFEFAGFGPFVVTQCLSDVLYRLRNCHTGKGLPSLSHIDRMRQYNADRDRFFTRNPDPDRMRSSIDDVPPPHMDDGPSSTVPVDLPQDRSDTSPPSTSNEAQPSALPNTPPVTSQSSATTWFTVKKIWSKRRYKGRIQFLVQWEDDSKSWVPQSDITPAAIDAYYVQVSQRKRRPRHPQRSS